MFTVQVLFSSGSIAQEPPIPTDPQPKLEPAAKPTPVRTSSPAVEEIGPEVLHLRDGQGRLIAIPGFSYEEFLRYYNLKHELEPTGIDSKFVVQQLSITGIAGESHVELAVKMQVVVHDSHWIKIPLRLGQLVLREPPKHDGPGEASVEFDDTGGGYVAWIRAEPESEHTLTFDALVPLASSAGDKRLELVVPRSTISQLELHVPSPKIRLTSQGMNAPIATPNDTGQTIVKAIGLNGSVSLGWQEESNEAVKAPVLLTATTRVLSTLDGRSTQSEATVTVSSSGGSFKQFQLRVPQDAQLIGGQQAGYKLTPGKNPGEVEVELENATVGPVDVRLITEQPYDVTRSNQMVQLASFDVVGAVRQWRQIAIAVVGDWKIVWGPQSGVRQINQWSESLQSKDIVAAYELVGQSSSLMVGVIPRIAKTHVEPQYVCYIEPTQVRLEAKLKYQIRGGKVFSLALDVEDWEIDEVTPSTIVNRNWTVEGTTLTLPLVQATSDELEITVRAKRPIADQSTDLMISMPRPRADVVSPANLLIAPTDNVVLEPLPEQMVGLNRQTSAPAPVNSLAQLQQSPLAYWADRAQATFVARYKVLPQQVSVRLTSVVTVETQQRSVAQRIAYHVAYEPLQTIELRIARDVLNNGQLEVLLDGQRIEPDTGGAGVSEMGDTARVQIKLARPRIGSFELAVNYQLPLGTLVPESTSAISVPLVAPNLGKVVSNEVLIDSNDNIKIENRSSDTWKPSSNPVAQSKPAKLKLVSTAAQDEVLLLAQLIPEDEVRSTIVEKALVQTWFSSEVRQDRAAYQISTAARSVTLKLPPGVDRTSVEVFVNRSRLINFSEANSLLRVELPQSSSNDYLLDVRYFIPGPSQARGTMRFELPAFEQDFWAQRIYWQLVLPRGEHLVIAPDQMTPEYRWRWNALHWGRVATLQADELESWVGLEPSGFSPEGTNMYLFSAIGNPSHVRVATVSRSLLVFASSSAVLILGLLLIYVRAVRHPAFLFVTSLVLFACCFIYPGPVLLIVQGSALGVGLALLALLLRRLSRPRQNASRVVRSAPSSIVSRDSTEYYHSGGYSPSSTATAAAIVDLSPAEAKP